MSDPTSLDNIITQTERVSELVIFSGKSGSGKTSLMNKLIELYQGIQLHGAHHSEREGIPTLHIRKAKKYTTRDRRPDDDPDEFIYVTQEGFEKLVRERTIAVQYKSEGAGNVLYGWSESELTPKPNEIVMTTANDEAVAKDLRYLRGSTNIFVDISNEVLKQRLSQRGGSPKEIDARIQKLRNEHKTIGYDSAGHELTIGMREHFFGTSDQLEGTAHVIIENYGNLELAAEGVFKEIVKLASEKRHIYRVPEQRRIRVKVENGQDVVKTDLLAVGDYARPSGKSFNRGDILNTARRGYDYLVTLGMVQGAIPCLGKPRYFIRISDIGDNIYAYDERSVMFRGCVLRSIESWAMPKGLKLWDLEDGLVEIGLSPTRRSAGNDESADVEVKSNYFDGTSSYRDIRKVFEQKGLNRLIEAENER